MDKVHNTYELLRTCDVDRQWSGAQPECKEINCGWPNNGIFPNGWFEASRTNLNAVITFRLNLQPIVHVFSININFPVKGDSNTNEFF